MVGDRGLTDAGGLADDIHFGTNDNGSRTVAHRTVDGPLACLRGEADGEDKGGYGNAEEWPGNGERQVCDGAETKVPQEISRCSLVLLMDLHKTSRKAQRQLRHE
ncbi:hypothetical protein GCM10011507_01200 [Edaphobacter acidisoli]|uniref:Uncharacterized protein n=1 Tax=Edaphobacter acidisoli TaxID=2040573 RepID=A0A916RDI9_9BACT|nr:hypothetical protein GCM10011507_01200 [Edaphobacter acidisoli]